jgi:cob(I)alamin adenosyltransferase
MLDMKGNIVVYTGDGGGKTAAALGLALRTAGHKKKAVIIQFMKGRKDIGEYMVAKRLAPDYEIYQFGTPNFIDLKNPSKDDKDRAQKGLEYAKTALEKKPGLLVLDEINIATAVGLLDKNEVLSFLKYIPAETITILTGRNAPAEYIDYADYVMEVRNVKRPAKDARVRAGFEY